MVSAARIGHLWAPGGGGSTIRVDGRVGHRHRRGIHFTDRREPRATEEQMCFS
jgi:hypothetical protein